MHLTFSSNLTKLVWLVICITSGSFGLGWVTLCDFYWVRLLPNVYFKLSELLILVFLFQGSSEEKRNTLNSHMKKVTKSMTSLHNFSFYSLVLFVDAL